MANVYENVGTFTPENLIYDTKVVLDTKTVGLSGGNGVLKRGTLIAMPSSGVGVPWSEDASGDADCILCDECDTGADPGEVIGHAYRTGHFVRQSIILADGSAGLTPLAEKQLRDAGIFLSGAVFN